MKIMASGPITSCQIDEENRNSERLYFGGHQNHCRWSLHHEIKTLAPWKKSYDQPRQQIKKQRDITLPTQVRLVKAMVFLVVTYGCENWTIKKAEHWRIDAFELWWWKTLLKVPWTARKSNQSTTKEFIPEYLLEGLMLKLKLQSFGHPMWRFVGHLDLL